MDKENGLKIKRQLKGLGLSFSSVAKSMPEPVPTPQAVRQVAFLIRKSQRIINHLALTLNKPVSEIWPETTTKEKDTCL